MPRLGVWLAALVWGGPMGAQTAQMVHAASAAFHSQRDAVSLTVEQRREADRLDQEAQSEMHAGEFGEALRRYAHATAVLAGALWTPPLEFVASLDGRIDHVMLDPGKPVSLALTPLYPSSGKSTASIVLVQAGRDGAPERELMSGAPVASTRLPFATRATIPETRPGTYYLEVRLSLPAGYAPPDLRRLYVKTFPVHIERLAEDAQRLRERLAKFPVRDRPALATAEYALQFYERTDRGQEGVRRFGQYPFREQLGAANGILDELAAGRDPFRSAHGDFHRAYRSPVDGTLQPYRIFIPERYDGRSTALVVALHGAGGDENDFFDDLPQSPLQAEAQRHGFIVVCPKGREPQSGYRGAAAQDVFDVLADVSRQYRIDPHRIYLMGHSMGAYATWRLAMEHPDVFAALGPIAGGGDPSSIARIARIPEFIVHGSADQTVPVTQSRAMAEAARRAGAEVVYVEVPGAGHQDAMIGRFGPMFDFFARHARAGDSPSRR